MRIEVLHSVEAARAILDEAAALFRVCFNRELDRRRWSQLYFLNPYGPPLVTLAYNEAGELIGHSGMIPQKLVDAGGREYDYSLSISLMVDPRHREGFATFYSLFSAATAAARERGVPFLLAFPNANSYLLIKHGFGWRDLVESRLYDWHPHPSAPSSVMVTPLERFRLGDEIGHPFDATYRQWRSYDCPYRAELVNDRLALIYKLTDDRILTVLDAQTDYPESAAHDLGALLAHSGATRARMSGVHAQALGFDLATLRLHGDYRLRLCYAPLSAQPPTMRFSLLLSDVF
ncbi:MAG: GNAT family N-acetyltransferase [Oscillochloridaceae bacterium]|nr:GNAT family N-acetyltransferase [Chloroflexaceae bacterium]MDW8389224.1 GNAT family N-acetyltransferase [Oscillochloridaceae bacterium]